jgi:hypothetical protein
MDVVQRVELAVAPARRILDARRDGMKGAAGIGAAEDVVALRPNLLGADRDELVRQRLYPSASLMARLSAV